MSYRRVLLSLLCLVTWSFTRSAQSITFQAQVDRTEISLDEQVTLTVSLAGNVNVVPRPKLPALNQFIVYEAGRSQNFSYAGGQVSSSVNFNYVLAPRMAGRFIIPPLEIQVEGKTYRTNPIEITVTGPGQAQPSPKAPVREPRPGQPQESGIGSGDIWIETSLDKDTVYVGQQVTLTLKFYQGVRLFQNPEYTPPTLTGFWTEDLPPQKRYHQNIGNRRYYVQEIKTALFPTTSGRKSIGSAELKCQVEDLESFLNRDPFSVFDEDLSQLFSQGKPKILRSQPLFVEVLPLPAGQPANFSGGAGKFNLKTELDKTEVATGQPVTLKITVSGIGNIRSVTAPALPELASFRTYNSSSSENISKADYKLQGAKTFEQILIPKEPGSFTIPPVEFSYFDVGEKQYRTQKSSSYTLIVKSSGSEALVAGPAGENQISPKIKDIHYLKTELGNSHKPVQVYRHPFFWALQSLPILALALLWRVQTHKEKLLQNPAYARARLAYKKAQTRLQQAQTCLASGNQGEFHSLLHKAISGYLSDKLDWDGSAVFTEEIGSNLKEYSLRSGYIQKITAILGECEQARFGRLAGDKNQKILLLEQTKRLLADLEKFKWADRAKTTA